MAFLFLFFTVALSLCVVGLIVIALAAILGSVRDDWKLKKPKREIRPGDYWFDNYCHPQSSSASRLTAGAFGFLTFTAQPRPGPFLNLWMAGFMTRDSASQKRDFWCQVSLLLEWQRN
jgi:hypothetical protein